MHHMRPTTFIHQQKKSGAPTGRPITFSCLRINRRSESHTQRTYQLVILAHVKAVFTAKDVLQAPGGASFANRLSHANSEVAEGMGNCLRIGTGSTDIVLTIWATIIVNITAVLVIGIPSQRCGCSKILRQSMGIGTQPVSITLITKGHVIQQGLRGN